jgi:nucleoside-diphosphate-sugar epimerase
VRVFVAGATGAIGRPLVRQLAAAGHDVTGTTRSQARAALIAGDGGDPVVVDALDRDALLDAVVRSRPDAVVHQLTSIPDDLNPRQLAEAFEATNRLRTAGTRNLVEAAAAAGASRIVAQSIAFAYRPDGDEPRTEEDELIGSDAPKDFRPVAAAVGELEEAVLGAGGIVLRYGHLYGPGTSYDPDGGSIAARVRKRGFPIVGNGAGVFPFIHVDDAASATVAALERGAPGLYNVVDDEPAPVSDWLPVYAESVGAKKPHRVAALAARIAAGPWMTLQATRAPAVSNAKARAELGWAPRHASWRQGFFDG